MCIRDSSSSQYRFTYGNNSPQGIKPECHQNLLHTHNFLTFAVRFLHSSATGRFNNVLAVASRGGYTIDGVETQLQEETKRTANSNRVMRFNSSAYFQILNN